MEIRLFSAQELPLVLRVLRTALSPRETLSSIEYSFLETYAQISGYQISDLPLTIAPHEVQLENTHKCTRLVQLAAMAVLLSRPLHETSVRFVTELDRHLRVDEPVIPVLKAILKGHRFRARLLTTRRGLRVILGETYRAEGWMGIVRFFAALLGSKRVNQDKLHSYQRLGLLPEGTLGREYWKHITQLGFGFPGEPGGIPDTIAYHDVSHVLNDYDTTPAGEIQQGSFQGGCRQEGGFAFVQFVILQFHQGIRITPVAAGEVGYFDPAKVLTAIHRGASSRYDVTHNWNYWPLMKLPIEEARGQCRLQSNPETIS